MTKPVWHEGPPPFIGWWIASRFNNLSAWRWWNGYEWSSPAPSDCTRKEAAEAASKPANIRATIYWTDHWPDDAPVPRPTPPTDQLF